MQSANILNYKRRKGTMELGTEYEVNMLALISLRYLHHTKEDFWLATNVEGVGPLDDIVLRIGQNTFMLQLKHKEKPDSITNNEFLHKKKSGFHLQSYVDSINNLQHTAPDSDIDIIKQLGSFDNIYFLLYTNRVTEEFDFLKEHSVSGYLSYLNSKVDSKTYQIGNCANINNFYLFCNQINATEARNKITEEIEKLIGKKHLDDVCKSYIDFITEWRNGKLGKPFCLTRNVIVSKLTELLFKIYEIKILSKPYGSYQYQQKSIWNKIIEDKIITIIDCKKDERIFCFLAEYIRSKLEKYCNIAKKNSWSNNSSEMEERSEVSIHLQKMLQAFENQDEKSLNHIYKCLWKEGRIPLVLKIHQADQYEQIVKALILSGFYYRIIIVNKCKQELTLKDSVCHFENLRHLNSQHKEDILQQQIKFQGRSGAKLKDLVDETMFTKIKTADIVNILLNNYNIGRELESVPTYYIPRRFENETSEDDLLSNLTTVISAGPGMGKSMLINRIAQQTTTDKWVVKIDLRKYNEYYQKLKHEYKNSETKSSEHLNYFRKDLLESGLEIQIFQKFLENGNVVVLMDGFDEIAISYSEEVINIAKSFYRDKLPLCLTTRPVEKPQLEKTFNVVALELLRFSFEDQKRFLQEYFSADKDCFINIKEIEKLLNSCKSDAIFRFKDYSFTSTPLHIQLIAEVCKMQKGVEFKENFDLVDLYRTFLTKKSEILQHKYDSTKWYDLYKNYQPLFALKLLFPHLSQHVGILMNQLELNDSRFIRILEEGGILTESGNFVHYTFAEFIAAEWLYKNINNEDENIRNIVENAYKVCTNLDYPEITSFSRYPFLLYIFNRLLIDDAKDFSKSICLSILNRNFEEVVQIASSDSTSLNTAVDKANRCVLQLIILCGRQRSSALDDAFAIIVKKTSKVHTDIFGYNPVDYAISYKLYDWANTMCKKWPNLKISFCVDVPHSVSFGLQNLWQYLLPYYVYRDLMLKNVAEHEKVNFYIETFFDNSELLVEDITISELPNLKLYTKMNLCYEVTFGSIDTVKKLLETNNTIINMIDSNGYAPLHYAAFYDETEIIKLLLSKNANSNISSTRHGHIPLQCSIICGQIKAFQELLNESSVDARDTSLHYAVAFKHLEMVELLLSKGADVNLQGPAGTPLHLVTKDSEQIVLDYDSRILPHRSIVRVIEEKEKSCRIIEKLVSKGADINAKRWIDGKTPIYGSVYYGNSKVVQKFIADGADVNAVDNSGNTVLHCALGPDHKSDLEIIKLLLLKGANVHAKNSSGQIPLHYGVKCHNYKIVDELIYYGRDTVNAQDKAGNTSLHHAMVNCRDLNIVRLLFLRNANVNIQNTNGNTPLHVGAKHSKNLNVIKLLLAKGSNLNTKDFEILSYKTAKEFILDKVDLNAQNKDGNTPLHEAILKSQGSIIELLLSNGADTDIKNFKDETPLHFAISCSDYKTIKNIIQYKPDVNMQNNVGDTPLHKAIEKKMIPSDILVIRLLVSSAANINIKNVKGESPLHVAVNYGKNEIVRDLLRYQANINAQDNIGNTPLHKAMSYTIHSKTIIREGQYFLQLIQDFNNPDTIPSMLLSNGADVNIANLNKETPLHICVKYNNYEGVKELIRKGANVNAKDIAGNTPLHYTKMFDVSPGIKHLLLSNGADVSLKNLEGKTPFD